MNGQYRLPLLLSLAFHAVLAALLLANIEFEKKKIIPKPVPEVVQATVIDESKVLAELQKLKQKEIDKKQNEQAKHKRLIKEQQKEKQHLADLKQKRVKEQKRAKELAAKNRAKEKATALKLKKEKVAQKKKLDKLKKEKQLANQKRQKSEAEKKRKAEVARKKKAEAEKRRKAEIARKKKAEANALAEKKKQEKLAKEQAEKEHKVRELALKQQMELERRAQQAVASFRDVIRQKIQRSWLKPSTSSIGLSCKIRVKLILGGSVMDARVVKSSGDSLFDRSVEVAVLKASPLPIPSDPELFSYFRTLDLIFIPKE
jgi:colicin import membrane protein